MQGNNDTEGPAVRETYEPQVGEMVQADGFNSGKVRIGWFESHRNGGMSAIVRPSGTRIFVRRKTIQPIEESK